MRLLVIFITISCVFISLLATAQTQLNATGSANSFSITYPAVIQSAPSGGMELTFKANHSITGPATLDVNGTGAKPIYKNFDKILEEGDIKAGHFVRVIYDNSAGGSWQMIGASANPLPSGAVSGIGSAGGVAFFTAATTLTTDAANLFWDNTNKRLGIGTNTPQRQLHLGATALPSLIWDESGQPVDTRIWGMSVNASSFYGFASNDAYSVTNNWVEVHRSTSFVTRVVFPHGNIGIGTVDPALKLDIRGVGLLSTTAPYTNLFQIGSTDAVSPLVLRMGIKTDAIATNRYAQIDVEDGGGGTHNLIIQPAPFSGYFVGIGTINPLHKLDTRTFRGKTITSPVDYIFQVGSQDAVPLGIRLGIKPDATAANRYGALEVDDGGTKRSLVLQPTGGNVGTGTTSPLVKFDVRGANTKGATLAFENVFQVASTDAVGPLTLRMGIKPDATAANRYGALEVDDGGTKRSLVLQPTGGNVGIGTIVPNNLLAIGGAASVGSAYTTIAAPSNGLIIQGGVGIGTSNIISFQIPKLRVDANGNGASATDWISISAGSQAVNTNRVVMGTLFNTAQIGAHNWDLNAWSDLAINSGGGNVGIALGSLTPVNTLDVNGTMAIGAYSGTNIAPTGGMIVSGSVGIGVHIPNTKLEVNGNLNVLSGLGNGDSRPAVSTVPVAGELIGTYAPATDFGYLRISAGGGSSAIHKSYIDLSGFSSVPDMDKNIVFGVNGLERMRIANGGNVGIGTNAPEAKLHIGGSATNALQAILANGNPFDPNFQLRILNGNGNSPGDAQARVALFRGTDENGAILFNRGSFANDGYITFRTSNLDRVYIKENGRVGIGILTPGYPLEVAGGPVAGAGAYVNTSDARYKTHITNISNALEMVLLLQGVYFEWDTLKHPEYNFEKGKQIGYLAQELLKIVPEAVSYDAKNDKYAVAYSKIIPLLSEAIKAQQQMLLQLRSENTKLISESAEISEQMASLQQQVDHMYWYLGLDLKTSK